MRTHEDSKLIVGGRRLTHLLSQRRVSNVIYRLWLFSSPPLHGPTCPPDSCHRHPTDPRAPWTTPAPIILCRRRRSRNKQRLKTNYKSSAYGRRRGGGRRRRRLHLTPPSGKSFDTRPIPADSSADCVYHSYKHTRVSSGGPVHRRRDGGGTG